jgi:hypothetical protein
VDWLDDVNSRKFFGPESFIEAARKVSERIDSEIISLYTKPPVDPDPIKLDESGEVVVLIKTTEGDLYLSVLKENRYG